MKFLGEIKMKHYSPIKLKLNNVFHKTYATATNIEVYCGNSEKYTRPCLRMSSMRLLTGVL